MADKDQKNSLRENPAGVLDRLIYERRSIRKYKKDPIPEAWVEAVLRCAQQAPSPSNSQPVRFLRIESQHYKTALRNALIKGHERLLLKHKTAGGTARLRNRINAYRRYSEFMFDAPVLLAAGISDVKEGFSTRLVSAGLMEPNKRQSTDMDISAGLALKGLQLRAQAMGVGSCILTAPLVFIEDVEKLLDLDAIEIKCFLTLGIPDENPGPVDRQPLENIYKVI